MDQQPAVKLTSSAGKVVDDVRWIYPWANNETLLYCVLCEGHLVRGATVAVFGASEAAAQVALLLHGVRTCRSTFRRALRSRPPFR